MAASPVVQPVANFVPWGALAAPHKPASHLQSHANILPPAHSANGTASPPHTKWVVQKFGGTSVGKFPRTIARDIVSAGLHDHRIAIVCSARSANTKSEGTTTRLLRAARAAEKSGADTFTPIVESIRDDHITNARATINSKEHLSKFVNDLNHECDTLLKILQSAQHLEEVSCRAEDKIVSKGEKLSCLYMVALLRDNGVPAAYVDLADVLRPLSGGHHEDTLDETFYKKLSVRMAEEVLEAIKPQDPADTRPVVPVITGYFGSIPGGLLHSVGRGYTDLCAALVAVGIAASELQIWKEVDGIFTADPRKVPTARLLSSVTPAEAAELTFYGSEVIHPFTMEQVIRARIPIRIKNVMNPRTAGTIIFPDAETEDSLYPTGHDLNKARRTIRAHQSTTNLPTLGKTNLRPKRPTAITVKKDIIVLNVHSNKRTRAHGFLMKIYSILDRWHLSVDLIASSEVHVSMALHSEVALVNSTNDERELAIASDDLYGALNELQSLGTVDIINNMAIISLVGKQLKNMVGISGRFLSTLGENNINIEMISQGASEINVSCVINAAEADRALNVIHTNLFTFLE